MIGSLLFRFIAWPGPLLVGTTVLCATVETTSHQKIRGEVSFKEPLSVLVRTNERDAATLSNGEIVRITFQEPSPPASDVSWQYQDVGDVFTAGSIRGEHGPTTLLASGWGWWNISDAFGFRSTPASGDGDLVVHLSGFHDSNGLVYAGITLRENLSSNSPHATLTVSSSGKVRLRSRPANDGESIARREGASWLRLRRFQDEVVAYTSIDGVEWEPVQETSSRPGGQVYAGLVVATAINGFVGGATFSDYRWMGADVASGFLDLPSRGVVLTDSSVLAGRPIIKGQSVIVLEHGDERWQIPWGQVAAILLRPAPKSTVLQEGAGRPGVLTGSGDFLEGRITLLSTNSVTIDSVLFGLKKIALKSQPAAIVLSGINRDSGSCAVRLKDNSIVRVSGLVSTSDAVEMRNLILGRIRAKVSDLREVEFAGSHQIRK